MAEMQLKWEEVKMAAPSKGKGGKQYAQKWLCVCACVCLCGTQTSPRYVALYELENKPSSVGSFKTKHSYREPS